MYCDVIVYVGKNVSDIDLFEQIPYYVSAFTECICFKNAHDAEAFLSFIVPGCVIADRDVYDEHQLRLMAKNMRAKGAVVYTYSQPTAINERKLIEGVDGDIERSYLFSAMQAIAKKINQYPAKQKHMMQPV